MQKREETGMLKKELGKLVQMVQSAQKEQRVQRGRESESAETQREAKGVQAMGARRKCGEFTSQHQRQGRKRRYKEMERKIHKSTGREHSGKRRGKQNDKGKPRGTRKGYAIEKVYISGDERTGGLG